MKVKRQKAPQLEEYKQYRDTDYYVCAEGRVLKKHVKAYTPVKGYVRTSKSGCKRIMVKIYYHETPLSNVVWETFRGPIPEGYGITHKNQCYTMNDLLNLRLTSRKEMGTLYGGTTSLRRKVICLTNRKIYKGTREAAEALRTNRQYISDICNNKLDHPYIKVAWYCDINGKAFRGNYQKYYERFLTHEN